MDALQIISSEPLAIIAICVVAGIGLLMGIGLEGLFGFLQRSHLERELERAQFQITHLEEKGAEKEAALELAEERLGYTFGKLANEQLQNNTETFLRLAKETLGTQQTIATSQLEAREHAVEALVSPLREALDRTQREIQSMEKARQEAYGGIHAQLQAMGMAQQALKEETQSLVNALRRPEVRGQWGEITLKRLVELAGMVEHCDFVEQPHTETETGVQRPDMLIHMPENRLLVVDVKTPLDAYLDATHAKGDAARDRALDQHANNVAQRIKELAMKTYWAQFSNAPEFVILFIPGDQFLSAALARRPKLLDDALSLKVILATPTSLVALLKAVAYGWRQLALADNAEEIRGLAVELHDRLSNFAGHMGKVGQRLTNSVDAYNRAVGSLERMVLPSARRFSELGVQTRQSLEELKSIERVVRAPKSEESSDQTENPEPRSGSGSP